MQANEPEDRSPAPGTVDEGERTTTGLDARLEAVLAYLFGVISGIVLLVIERDSRFVRFHAMQSTLTFGAIFIVSGVLQVIPVLGGLVGAILGVVGFVLWLHLMLRAWRGQYYKLPWIGDRAELFL